MVEDRERLKLVGVITGHDVCCGVTETVKETRRKLHAHRVTSLPVAEKAGGCL
jgi:CBS domain-containing protein